MNRVYYSAIIISKWFKLKRAWNRFLLKWQKNNSVENNSFSQLNSAGQFLVREIVSKGVLVIAAKQYFQNKLLFRRILFTSGLTVFALSAQAQVAFERVYAVNQAIPRPVVNRADGGWSFGDFDNDGDKDLLTGGLCGVTYFRNVNGDFFEVDVTDDQASFYFNKIVNSAVFVDLDNDQDLDVVACSLRELYYFENQNNLLVFKSGVDNPFDDLIIDGRNTEVSFGDVDGDSDLDMLVSSESGGNDSGGFDYFKNVDGSFIEISGGLNPFDGIDDEYGARPYFVDYDNDNDVDLVVNRSYEMILLKNDSSTFSIQPDSLNPFASIGGYYPAFVDWDDDGDIDVIVKKSIKERELNVNNDGVFDVLPIEDGLFDKGVDIGTYVHPTFVDIDLDGDLDLVSSSYYEGLKLIRNDSSKFVESTWGNNAFGLDNTGVSGRVAPLFVDYDMDGDLDLLIGEGRLKCFNNVNDSLVLADPNPFASVTLSGGPHYMSPAMGDIDNDGDLDLLVGTDRHGVLYYENNLGIFEKRIGTENPFSFIDDNWSFRDLSPVLVDFDLDGDLDLLCGDFWGDLYYFRNDSSSYTFLMDDDNPFEGICLGYLSTPAIIDLDHDGDKDLVVGNALGRFTEFRNVSFECSNAQIDSLEMPSCSNPNGYAVASAPRAVEPLSVVWNTDSIQNSARATFNATGIYTASIVDAEGCQSSVSVPIVIPASVLGEDLRSTVFAPNFRPGFTRKITLIGKNQNCEAATGVLSLTLDSTMDFISATTVPDSVQGDIFYWGFSGLSNDTSQISIDVNVRVNSNTPLGQTVCLTSDISSDIPDVGSNNGRFVYCDEVIGSYDPNDIRVTPSGECDVKYIETDQTLTYFIRFQNTGTASAINVRIDDTLSTQFDMSSFRLIDNSHPMITEIHEDSILVFRFDDIELPDSNANEPASHGHVVYQINPIPGVAEFNELRNGANIYFDYNLPVITNQVLNTTINDIPAYSTEQFESAEGSFELAGQTFTETGIYTIPIESEEGCDSSIVLHLDIILNTEELEDEDIGAHPNPVSDVLVLTLNSSIQATRLRLIDLNGQEVKRLEGGFGIKIELPISGLKSGVYIVEVESNQGLWRTKLLKE